MFRVVLLTDVYCIKTEIKTVFNLEMHFVTYVTRIVEFVKLRLSFCSSLRRVCDADYNTCPNGIASSLFFRCFPILAKYVPCSQNN